MKLYIIPTNTNLPRLSSLYETPSLLSVPLLALPAGLVTFIWSSQRLPFKHTNNNLASPSSYLGVFYRVQVFFYTREARRSYFSKSCILMARREETRTCHLVFAKANFCSGGA